MSGTERIRAIETVARLKCAAPVEGYMVQVEDALVIMALYHRLNSAARDILLDMHLSALTRLAWRLDR